MGKETRKIYRTDTESDVFRSEFRKMRTVGGADESVLAHDEIEIVELETISGPRRVRADRVDRYADVLVGGDE